MVVKPLTMTEEREAWYRSTEGTACAPLYVPDLLAEIDALRAKWDAAEEHAGAMASHLQSLADNGYEFHSPANCDRVDALLAAHAARVPEKP